MDQTIRYSIERHKAQEKRRKIIRRERMHVKMLLLLCFISCLLPSISFDVVQASGVFELELIKLTETRPDFRESPANDSLSRAPVTTPATLSADPTTAASAAEKLRRVFVCLKEAFTSQPIDGPCTFGNASIIVSQQQQDSTNQSSTQTLTTAPTVATDEQQQQQGSLLTNIVRIPITFKWTVSFLLFFFFSSLRIPGEVGLQRRHRLIMSARKLSRTSRRNLAETSSMTRIISDAMLIFRRNQFDFLSFWCWHTEAETNLAGYCSRWLVSRYDQHC